MPTLIWNDGVRMRASTWKGVAKALCAVQFRDVPLDKLPAVLRRRAKVLRPNQRIVLFRKYHDDAAWKHLFLELQRVGLLTISHEQDEAELEEPHSHVDQIGAIEWQPQREG